MKFFSIVTAVFAAAACMAATLPEYLHIRPDGTLVLDGRWNMDVRRFDTKWKSLSQRSTQIDVGFPQSSGGAFETRGVLDSFRLAEKVQAADAKSFRWQLRLEAVKDPVECNLVYFAVDLPLDRGVTLTIDGKKIEMTTATQKKNVHDARVKQLQISDPDGTVTISGDFRAVAAGAFQNKEGDYFQLRLLPVNAKFPAKVAEWELSLDIEAEFTKTKVKAKVLDLSKAFNRSFVDEVAEDGKGGWSDQGPEMDLRAFTPGEHNFFGLPMKTVGGDQSCLVLGRGTADKAKVGVKAPAGMNHLYLLHASAWTPAPPDRVGTIKATYADGSSEEIAVIGGRDCGNWYKPVGSDNSRLAWEGSVPAAGSGLYLSYFPLKGVPAQLEFIQSDKDVMWMIAGATLADGKLRLPRRDGREFIVKNGPQWLPIDFSGDTAPGTPLDFSMALDAPAGKYGYMIADKNGYFSFENAPEKRIRLFGPNLVGSANYLPREMVDDFINKAERLGYNTIRFHHFEQDLLNRKAPDSLTINPVALDQLHYLFARLKERGFYLCIDLYASRVLKKGDNIPEWDDTGDYSMKNLVCISPAAMANWKEFSRRVLTAKNPYTGMTMAEDPALYSLNLVNENPLIQSWNATRSSRKAGEIIRARFEEYLKTVKFDDTERNGLFIQFLNDLQAKSIDEQMRFLKEEIKLKALVTDFNHLTQYTLAGLRSKLDFVDNHQYWDHPSFPAKRWNYPFVFRNQSSISLEAANPRQLMPTRVFGKPFTVTEFNFCVPNTWRVECPSVFGAYAALQDWDGLYRFAWSHGNAGMKKEAKRRLSQFDIVNNIQAQMAERIIYMLFVRGDVQPAKEAVAFEFRPEMVREVRGSSSSGHYPAEFSRLGLWGRIGSLTQENSFPGVVKVNPLAEGWQKSLPAAANAMQKQFADTGSVTSSTGEITLETKANTIRIVTPKSEVFTTGKDITGKVLAAKALSCYQTLALHSLDDKPLAESGRLLLIQLTDLSNDGLRFDSDKRRVLRDWGAPPHMLERGSAELTLGVPAKMKVVALELDGTPGKEVPAEYKNGKLTFRAATDFLSGGTLSYLLTVE